MGTAQIGLPGYGVANRQGEITDASAADFLRDALTRGINMLDSARAYGRAEQRVGQALAECSISATVFTKVIPLSGINLGKNSAVDLVEKSVSDSLTALKLSRLPFLSLHQWADRHFAGGEVWDCLLGLQQKGLIEHLGASLQNPSELIESLDEPAIDYVQIPFNILDWRWQKTGALEMLQSRSRTTVHVRSIYLQGLLFTSPDGWPHMTSGHAAQILDRLQNLAISCGRESVADLAMATVASCPWVDGIVIGMENQQQLQDNLRLIKRRPLDASQRDEIARSFLDVPAELLDPSTWPHE